MNLRRIFAIIERDTRITLRLKWKLVETFYFPLTSVVIWGLFTIWAESLGLEAAFTLLAINMFWSFAYHSQSGSNQQIMEDRWTESFKQIVTTPLRPSEYLVGKIFLAAIFSLVSFIFTLFLAYFVFNYTIIFDHLGYFLLFSFITLTASIGITILVASIITLLGNEYAFFSWSTMQVFILFSAPFFPLSIYPGFLQIISKYIPYTWVFESIRMLSLEGFVNTSFLTRGVILGVLYMLLSIPLYSISFEIARKKGKLVKIW